MSFPLPSSFPRVLVTVGTTKFDALVSALDTPEAGEALAALGCEELVIQCGDAPALPRRLADARPAFHVRTFRYAPTLAREMAEATLVVSHAGAGSLFEALAARKVVLAVPNGLLMDDHQTELVQKLQQDGVLLGCRGPDRVVQALWNLAKSAGGGGEGEGQKKTRDSQDANREEASHGVDELRAYEPGTGQEIRSAIDALVFG